MDEQIRSNLKEVLSGVLRAVQKDDIKSLKELSNMTIHTASILQDHYSISIAVLIYSLAKIFERSRYESYSGWQEFKKNSVATLEKCLEEVDHGEDEAFEETVSEYFESINNLDKKLREYIQEVLHEARISKGSRIYEHGISIERTAHLLGVSQYDLMKYVGQTHIPDIRIKVLIPAKERMRLVRRLFK